MFRATLACLVVLFSCTATVNANAEAYIQGAASADEAAKPDLHARLEKLGRDKHIRVQPTTRGVLQGKISTLTHESMAIVVETPDAFETHTIALSDVDKVWKRNGHTLVGGLLGALVGGLLGAALAPDERDDHWDLDPGTSIVAGALLGTVVGLVAGSQIRSYSRIYP